jgi:hypothetical protein
VLQRREVEREVACSNFAAIKFRSRWLSNEAPHLPDPSTNDDFQAMTFMLLPYWLFASQGTGVQGARGGGRGGGGGGDNVSSWRALVNFGIVVDNFHMSGRGMNAIGPCPNSKRLPEA